MEAFKLFLVVGLICVASRQVNGEQSAIRTIHLSAGLTANMSVGYPPQHFGVLFNTGSANTWVVAQGCRSDYCLSRPNKFNVSLSSTHSDDGRSWRTNYGVGAVFTGSLNKDTVGLGGAFVSDQLIGELDTTFGWMVDHFNFDGVLGLGSRFSPALNAQDPIQTAYRQRLIPEQMFSLHVTKNAQDEFTGTALLGGVDQRYFSGEINYAPAINRWNFYLDYMSVANSDVKYSVRSKALIDSSSNVVMAPLAVVQVVRTAFDTNLDERTNLARFESCEQIPDVHFNLVVNGARLQLSARDLVIKLENGRRATCYLALQTHIEDGWILGTPFLRKYYTVFDYTNKRLGFALST